MQTISNDERLIHILERIAEKLNATVPFDIDLWSSDQIAAYLKKDRRKVMERVVCLPDFPKAIRLPSVTGGKQHPLWKACEVIQWVESYQER
jgi:prophage regulatory protein